MILETAGQLQAELEAKRMASATIGDVVRSGSSDRSPPQG